MTPRQSELAYEWLRRAKSNFIRANHHKQDRIYFEDLCFDAQQAAEKALKALYVAKGREVPDTHDIGELLEGLESFLADIPLLLREASVLTDYAVVTRYPGWGNPVTKEEYDKSVMHSESIFTWVMGVLNVKI